MLNLTSATTLIPYLFVAAYGLMIAKRCGIGSWAPSVRVWGDYVRGPGATRGAGGAGGRSC